MSELNIKVGDYTLVGPHKECKYGGKLMKCTAQTIDGQIYPKTPEGEEPITEWLWCNGKKWAVARKDESIDSQEVKQWLFCGYSTRPDSDKVR